MSFNNRNFFCCWGGSKKKASSKEWNGELSRAQPIFWYSNFTNYLLALSDVVQSYLNTKIDKIIYTKSSRFFYNLEKIMKNIITFMFIFIVKFTEASSRNKCLKHCQVVIIPEKYFFSDGSFV